MLVRRSFALLTLAMALVVIPAAAASAHAELVSTTPGDQAIVTQSPPSIRLRFSEGVTVQPDGVRVLDGDAKRVDRGEAKRSGSEVTVPIEADLAPGSYLVAWRVISDDSHPVHGAFTFSVSTASTLDRGLADKAFAGSSDRRNEIIAGGLRIAAYVGALLAAGLVAMGALLRREDEPTPVGPLAVGAAIVAAVAIVLEVPVQGALATGQGLRAIAKPGVLSLALGNGVGIAAAVSLVGLVAVALGGGLAFRGAPRAVALAGAVLAPVGFAVSGHTRTMSPAVIGYLADLAHLLAGAAWFGGLVALVLVVRRRRAAGDDPGAVSAVASFSGWAAVLAGTVVVAGTAMGWLEVGGWHALTSTTYGQVLLVKVGVVAAVMAGAAWNRYRLVPALAERAQAWPSLLRVVRFEAVALVAVLGLTGALVNITPARTAAKGGIVTTSVRLGDGRAEVIVDPARVGKDDIHVYLLDATGRPDDRYPDAAFALSLPARDIGPIDRTPVRAGPGHFQLIRTSLTPAGSWALTITVQPDKFTETKATVTFPIR